MCDMCLIRERREDLEIVVKFLRLHEFREFVVLAFIEQRVFDDVRFWIVACVREDVVLTAPWSDRETVRIKELCPFSEPIFD